MRLVVFRQDKFVALYRALALLLEPEVVKRQIVLIISLFPTIIFPQTRHMNLDTANDGHTRYDKLVLM